MTASRVPAVSGGPDLGAGIVMIRELGSRVPPTFVAQRARDGGSIEHVVVERISRDSGGSAEAAAALVRTGKRIATLAHPNLVRVRGVEVRADEVLIVSDFVDAERYDDVLNADAKQEHLMPLVVHLRVLVDVLAGLSALHLLRDALNEPMHLVHGEVCPANVLLGLDGNARLSHLFRVPGERGTADALGYLAPEVRLDDTAADQRADVYSCGVLLWEALAGRRLFDENHDAKILTRQLADKIARAPVSEDLAWARPLAEVAARALAADPSARYATAAEMAAEIRKMAGAKLAPKSALASAVKDACGDIITARRRGLARARGETSASTRAPKAEQSGEIVVGQRARLPSVPTPSAAIPRDVLNRALRGHDEETARRRLAPGVGPDEETARRFTPALALPRSEPRSVGPDEETARRTTSTSASHRAEPIARRASTPPPLPSAASKPPPTRAPASSASPPMDPARIAPPPAQLFAELAEMEIRISEAPPLPTAEAAKALAPPLPAMTPPLTTPAAVSAPLIVPPAPAEVSPEAAACSGPPPMGSDADLGTARASAMPVTRRRLRAVVAAVVSLMLLILVAAVIRNASRKSELTATALARPAPTTPVPSLSTTKASPPVSPVASPAAPAASTVPPPQAPPPAPVASGAPTTAHPTAQPVPGPAPTATAPVPNTPKAPKRATYDPLGI